MPRGTVTEFARAAAVIALAVGGRGESVAVAADGTQQPRDVGVGSVEDVAGWLDEIGFADLKKAFAKNEIDGPALREITEEELKELGVKKVGARKQFGRLLCEALPDCERPDLSAPAGEINVSAFSVEEVGDWLKAEGFGDVRAKFVANAVDGPALLDLNEDELKAELGVSRLGPRRRFARKLCAVMPGCRNPKREDEAAAWSTDDVAGWLDRIGLGKYKKAFARHEVDGLTLPDIAEEDLKAELGILEIGLRKRYRLKLCELDSSFCQREREGAEGGAGADMPGMGGLDLGQYVQRAQQFLQQQAGAAGGDGAVREIDLGELVRSALAKSKEAAAEGGGGEGDVATAAKLAAEQQGGQPSAGRGAGRTVLAADGSAAVTDDLGELEKLMEMLADEEGDNGPAREG